MKKILSTLLLLLSTMVIAMAQGGAPLNVTPLSGIALPWGLGNLSIVDGRLYACQNGVLVCASENDGTVTSLQPGTALIRLCPEAQFQQAFPQKQAC